MIKAFDITKFGSYIDFNWKKDVGNYNSDKKSVFFDINIFYGRNYSGKTTLSRILGCLEKKRLNPDYLDADFKIILENGDTIYSNSLDNNFNIKIYNSDFVKENLKWFYDEECEIKPFAILGEKNIEIQNEIDKLELEITNINEEKNILTEKINKKENLIIDLSTKLQKNLTEEARKIKENTILYNEVNYNRTKLIQNFKLISEDKLINFLDAQKIVMLEKEIRESPKKEITLLKKIEILAEKEINRINELLEYKIKISKPIEELLNDSYLEKWVYEGKKINKNRKTCAFCGGTLDDDLWGKINSHFNKESENLNRELDFKINNIKDLEQKIKLYQILDYEKIITIYIEDVKNKVIEFERLKKELENYYSKIKEKISEKKEKISEVIEPISFQNIKINEIIESINEVINKHNEYCQENSSKKEIARKKLLKNKEKEIYFKLNYNEKVEEIKINEEELNLLKKEMKDTERRYEFFNKNKLDLERKIKDETKSCNLINRYLNEYFGRKDLVLKIEDPQNITSFSIYRNDKLAKNLSEGECRLISFCYFLATINDYKNDKNLILWIDDPISSLDTNQIFFTFGILDNIISHYNYKQLFISTHNLDFFKYLKKLKNLNQRKINYFLIERKEKKGKYTSKISKMPNYLKNYITEFHFLFKEIYNIGEFEEERLLNTYTQIFNIPNNVRKFLEYYLFYKYPNTDFPLKNLDKIFSQEELSSINRLINENSHLTFIDRGYKPIDIPEVKKICKIILAKLEKLDLEQYNALKESVNIEN